MKYLKKYTSFFLILIFFFFIFTSKVASQEATSEADLSTSETTELNFDQAYKDYQEQIEVYRVSHEEYVLRRSQYLRFGTLKSQQDAHDATVVMLQERDSLLVSYLVALRERLDETIGVDEARRQGLMVQINEEVGWFEDHKQKVPSAGTLDDLVEDSKDVEKRFTLVEPLFYEVLSSISLGRVTYLEERLKDTFSKVKEKVDEIKKEDREGYTFSARKIQILDRWVLESENRIVRADEKQIEAESIIASFGDPKERRTVLNLYSEAIGKIVESQQFLKESSSFMKEIVREIKTAEE